MMGWYEEQRRRDAESRALSESLLGMERQVFEEAMALMAECLDAVSASDWPDSLSTRRKIQYACHAFNLLWSAWDLMLAGRYGAARQLERSINESADFLEGLYIDPDLADRIPAGTKDLDTVRRTVQKALNRRGTGTGTEWLRQRQEWDKMFQASAHVSGEATSLLAVEVRGTAKTAYVRPRGVVAEPTLRLTANGLAAAADALLPAMVLAFTEVPDVNDLWERLPSMCERHRSVLGSERQGLNYPSGEVDYLISVKSDEEVTT